MTPEAWLRGPLPGVNPLTASVLYTFQQVREELAGKTEGLSDEQVWASPCGMTPLGFHIRHIGGSVERLATYLMGRQLDEDQLAQMKQENEPGVPLESLLACTNQQLASAEELIRGIDTATFGEPRYVGRQKLPTTVIGLLVHIAEHTQRHLGQAISAVRLVRATTSRRASSG
jgi:hypothetical protein